MFYFPTFQESVTDRRTDGRTKGHTLTSRFEDACRNENVLRFHFAQKIIFFPTLKVITMPLNLPFLAQSYYILETFFTMPVTFKNKVI